MIQMALCGDLIWFQKNQSTKDNLEMFQFKLSKDEDKRNANYMDKDTNGHVSQKKIKVVL